MPKYILKNVRLSRLCSYFIANSPEEAEYRFRRMFGRMLKTCEYCGGYGPRIKKVLAERLASNDFEVEETNMGGISLNEVEILDGNGL